MTSPLPDKPVTNASVAGPLGEEVLLLDVIPIEVGSEVVLTFEQVDSPWRQGVWLATDDELEVNGARSSPLVVWQDTAPPTVRVRVGKSDGMLRYYNLWDSGRGMGEHESQSATSGMLRERGPDGSRRYRCNDIGYESQFDKLVFSLRTG